MLGKLLSIIRKFEGLRLRAYLCSAGVPTNGIGHTGKDVWIGMPDITVTKAEEWLAVDANVAWCMAIKLSPILALHQDRATAIADFIFNLGSSRYKASTLRRKIDEQDWEAAKEEIQKWVWGGGRKLPGLVARRLVEAGLL